jgi:protein-S-isoprenylcysteine O-methyltransferase Ste14
MNNFMFKYRGGLFIPAALLMLFIGKPTFTSIVIGFLISFVIGEGIRIWAVGFSGITTRSNKIEAPELVTSGPYAHVRNPIYVGNFISWMGFCIASTGSAPLWATFIIYGITIFSNILIYGTIIPLEEEFLENKFGEVYRKYKKAVPSVIPTLKSYNRQQGTYKIHAIRTHEIQTILMLFIVASLIIIKHLII